ncbi:MAG: transcriptional regulator, MerR family [Firmicutes bacterium]|nr:transcriptional regulator, MerR family [Bacillota bacterium]
MIISEVSAKYGMTQDALRYYERVGLIPPVPRKPNGIREYDDYSCGWIEFIHCMRNAGIPVEILVEYVQLYQQGSTTKEARKELLQEELNRLDDRIANLQATRGRLACKIENYDDLEKS